MKTENVSEVKKDSKEKGFRRVAILIPEKSSLPQYIIGAIRFAKILKTQIHVFASIQFASQRPSKHALYFSLLEKELQESRTPWAWESFDDSFLDILAKFSHSQDIVIIPRDDSADLLKEVMKNAACPVLVFPTSCLENFHHVLLAYAGGRFSERALCIAAILARNERSHIKVFTVGSSSSPSLRMAHNHARLFLDMLKVNAKYQIVTGHVTKEILKACESDKISLLILGASETSEWKDHHFRSLSLMVVEQARCPVLVVK